jgi:hypothetical protein
MCQAWMTFLEIRKIKNKKQMLTNQIKEKAWFYHRENSAVVISIQKYLIRN